MGVAARNVSGDVLVSWDAASDNVGVTGYRIYRDGVQTGVSTSLSFTDVALIAGRTHRYTVIAHDAAGNPSTSSTGITLTVEAGPTATPRENRNPLDVLPFPCAVIPNDKRCK
jgi:alpha-amylase